MTARDDAPATSGEPEDAALDRFDRGVEPATAEEAAAQAPYRRMVERMRQLAPLTPPDGWEQRAEARLRAARAAERRQRAIRLGVGVGLGVVAAAVVAVLLLRGSAARAPRPLEVAFAAVDGEPRRGPAALGDRLRASVAWPRGEVELRVYLGTRLVARCPAAQPPTTCRRERGELALELDLREPGIYRVFALASPQAVAPPGEGGLDGDLLHARQAGARVQAWEPVRIR